MTDDEPKYAAPQYTPEDYRNAVNGEGPLAFQWKDKPHRLVYDICTALDKVTSENWRLQRWFQLLEDAPGETKEIIRERCLSTQYIQPIIEAWRAENLTLRKNLHEAAAAAKYAKESTGVAEFTKRTHTEYGKEGHDETRVTVWPPACQGCTDDASPLYQFTLALSAAGWEKTRRIIWLCAMCQHALAFEEGFLFEP